MLTLIKREIQDNLASIFVVLLYVAICLTWVSMAIVVQFKQQGYVNIGRMPEYSFFVLLTAGLLGLFGSFQVTVDRVRKVSTFLCTLAATRAQVFAAQAIVGLILTGVSIMMIAITYAILLQRCFGLIIVVYPLELWRVLITFALLCAAGYATGLLAGVMRFPWFSWLVAAIFITVLGFMLVFKGCRWESWILLGSVGAAALATAWRICMEKPM